MMNVKQIASMSVAALAASTMMICMVPSASAANQQDSVVSSRSFPKVAAAKKNLLAEATFTSVDENSSWGGIESLDVPQTQSQAEKDAEAAQKAADEAAAAAAQAQSTATSQAGAASRSSQRTSLPQVDLGTATGSGSEVARYATQFQGYPYVYGGNTPSGWDCSGFVQYVYAQFGISLPRTSGAQAAVGTAIGSLAEAQPGDIIANSTHAGIYIGNGMVMNAMTPALGTQISSIATTYYGGYSIRRVL